MGRNYFNRFDGSEVVEEEDAEERVQILADAAALKKEAVYYNCPEAPVHVDPTAFGRNFFMADSDFEVDEKERERILDEATMLKELATNYQHPEVKVDSSDATLFGRNSSIGLMELNLMKRSRSVFRFYPKETNLRKQQLIILTLNVQFLLLIPHGLHIKLLR